MEKQKQERLEKKIQLDHLKSQKTEYESANATIQWKIEELKSKKKQVEQKMEAYQEKLIKFRYYPNEFEDLWKGDVYQEMTKWFWKSEDVDYAWILLEQMEERVERINRKIEELENQKESNGGILSNILNSISALTNEIKLLID